MADTSKQEEYYNNGGPIRTDQLHNNDTHESVLEKVRTAGSVSIPPELFEKLYLSPETRVHGDLRRTIGNPTPIGIAGFLMSLTPLTCDLMGFRGKGTATGRGASDIAIYLFFGGILMNYAGVVELLLGNTFIAVVFGVFGCFWLGYGGTLQPFYGAYSSYSPNPTTNPAAGANAPPFLNSFGFFLLFMGLICIVFLICAIRTNVILIMVLLPLPFTFCFLAAAFFYGAEANLTKSAKMEQIGGGFAFVTCMFGWYLFFALMFASIDFPIQLPVFDLSTKIKGASEKKKKADDNV